MNERDEVINLDQVCVERLVHDLTNNIAELQSLRLQPETTALVASEEVNLGKALTGLQVLCANIAVDQPRLRLVKR